MQVIERATTPNGIGIQIEDWHNDYDFHKFGDTIAIYPLAKQSDSEWVAVGETFRLSFICGNNEQARQVFEQLKNGTKTVKQVATEFNADGKKYL